MVNDFGLAPGICSALKKFLLLLVLLEGARASTGLTLCVDVSSGE